MILPEGIQYRVHAHFCRQILSTKLLGEKHWEVVDRKALVVQEGIQYQAKLLTGLCGSARGHSIPSPALITGLCGSARGHSIPSPADNGTVW